MPVFQRNDLYGFVGMSPNLSDAKQQQPISFDAEGI